MKKIMLCFFLATAFSTPNIYAQNFEKLQASSAPETQNTAQYSEQYPAQYPAQNSAWHYVRRAEIITLGAMPFVTLLTSLGFSIGRYIYYDFDSTYSPNPFAKGEGAFTQKEQVAIILTAVGISVGIGLTDLTIQLVKRSKAKKRAEQNRQRAIEVTPVALDKTATKLPPPRRHADTHIARIPPQ